jgi:rare lipoprotein A (peptidoglycan hydrolase)
MKYVITLAAMLLTTSAHAGFLEDIFGGFQTEQVAYGKHSKHINTNSAGHHNASWYNDRSGRTASGMRSTYGVAHKTLPFGTRVLITNPANGKSVTAVVTDRGPFVRGRTLDVNQNVAQVLGFKSHGTARLHMEVQ